VYHGAWCGVEAMVTRGFCGIPRGFWPKPGRACGCRVGGIIVTLIEKLYNSNLQAHIRVPTGRVTKIYIYVLSSVLCRGVCVGVWVCGCVYKIENFRTLSAPLEIASLREAISSSTAFEQC
jgi:hypothetical protein